MTPLTEDLLLAPEPPTCPERHGHGHGALRTGVDLAGADLAGADLVGAPTRAGVTPGPSALSRLSQRLDGAVLRASDAEFEPWARPLNLRYAGVSPSAIALCESAEDVVRALDWCRTQNVPVVARSGGHSYGGYSTTPGLMVNMGRMTGCRFDEADGTVTVGGGAQIRHVRDALRPHGVAITHGRCSTVGVAGMLLGGGTGFNMRWRRLGCDQLIETEVACADGRVRVANATTNADLYWACRGGGGGNFGINTSFTLQTFPVGRTTVFDMAWEVDTRDVLHALLETLDVATRRAGSRVALTRSAADRTLKVTLLGQLHGPKEEVAELLSGIAPPHRSRVMEVDYWTGADHLDEQLAPLHFHESCAFLPGAPSRELVDLAHDYLASWPGTEGEVDVRFFQTGGAVNDVAADATAFVHRDTRWLMVAGLTWGPGEQAAVVDRNLAWQKSFYDGARRFSTGGAYQNLLDPSLADWRETYYGRNLPKLLAVKQRVDPTRLFRFAQGL